MKNTIDSNALITEASMLRNSLDQTNLTMDNLRGGLPNREKGEALLRLREATHWLNDAIDLIARNIMKLEQEAESKKLASIVTAPREDSLTIPQVQTAPELTPVEVIPPTDVVGTRTDVPAGKVYFPEFSEHRDVKA